MIKLLNVFKKYGDKYVLRNFSLDINKGDKYCIMGRSGIGKSTLLNIIMGLETPDSGEVKRSSKLRTACVFQDDRLVEGLTAEKNILLTCGKKNILPYAAEIGLFETDLKKPIEKLSGGEKRRVAILRAVLCESDLLIFDEAMQGLDILTEEEVAAFVLKHLNGRALIAVTHSDNEAQFYGGDIIYLTI